MTVSNDGITMYNYDANNRLITEEKVLGNIIEIKTYTYDNNGNTLSRMSETFTRYGTNNASLGFDNSGTKLYS